MATSGMPEPQLVVPLSMLDHPGLSVVARMVWLRLRGHLNRKTGQCNPRQATLARELNVSINTVHRAIVQLRQAGAVASRRTQYGCSYTFQIPHQRVSETDSDTPKWGFPNPTSAEAKPQNGVSEVAASLLTEPDELNHKNEPAAADVCSIPTGPAAAADVSSGYKPKTESDHFPKNFPGEFFPTRETAEQLVAELMPLHPEPGNAPKAVAEVEKLLADAPGEFQATVDAIRAGHALWRARWAEYAAGRFIPMLPKWLHDGDWRVTPVERKGVKGETWLEKRDREKHEYDEKFYRELAEDEEWDVIRQYGGESAVEVWREKIKAIA